MCILLWIINNFIHNYLALTIMKDLTPSIRRTSLAMALVLFFILSPVLPAEAVVIKRIAKNTLTPVEMNIGDTLLFRLRNGETRVMILTATDAQVTLTNLETLKKEQKHGATLYHFTCDVTIDGHPMTMLRYVGSQESYYEPYVINGMRIWLDGVADIFDKGIVGETHGKCRPGKDARFAVADMNDRICPEYIFPFYENKELFIDISTGYNGDDCWMGAYNGFDAHGGMDVNLPGSTPNLTPFGIDDHYFFNSLYNGDNNNRWRGIRTWPNGDRWIIQNHHMFNLRYPEHEPIPGGVHYCDASGVYSGSHEHAHYVFRIEAAMDEDEILLDPWILFWQGFEDSRVRNGELRAVMQPFSPSETGVPVRFSAERSVSGISGRELRYSWTFGDGGFSMERAPEYVFSRAGIFPVTLTVDDGSKKASFTQHITVDGSRSGFPALVLAAPDEPSFRLRSVQVMDVYGRNSTMEPHTITFLARETRPVPDVKSIDIRNIGDGTLPEAVKPGIVYRRGGGWLNVTVSGTGNDQYMNLSADGTGLPGGIYQAVVSLDMPGVVNGKQGFRVEMIIPAYPPSHSSIRDVQREIVDNETLHHGRFYCTPWFWVGPRFSRWTERGYGGFYLTNGGRSDGDEYARFRPDLEAGTYEVSFAPETPFDPQRRAMDGQIPMPVNRELNPDPRFEVRIKHRNGDDRIWVKPAESTIIGIFEFSEGMDGFVDILSKGSTGQVLVDAIVFKKL